MSIPRGRKIPLSLSRRWVGDLLHFSQGVPLVVGERTLRIGPVAQARRQTSRPHPWHTLLVKAFGLVSQRIPELRRAYLPFPWPHLYEAPESVCTVVVDRIWQGEHTPFLAPLPHPETWPLEHINAQMEHWKTDRPELHGPFRRLIKLSAFPRPIRRAAWAAGLYLSGAVRAAHFGTFAINSMAAFRGRAVQIVSPITNILYYGRVTDGTMDVQFGFDHRVYDAYIAGRAVGELENVLNNEIVSEIRASQETAHVPAQFEMSGDWRRLKLARPKRAA